MALSVLGFSIPAFVIGYLLILGLSMSLDIFPSQGYVSPFVDPWGRPATWRCRPLPFPSCSWR